MSPEEFEARRAQLEGELKLILDKTSFFLLTRGYTAVRPGPRPLPPPALSHVIKLVQILSDASRPEYHPGAFSTLSSYFPLPEELLDFVRCFDLDLDIELSVERKWIDLALEMTMPWLNWEEERVAEIHALVEDYLDVIPEIYFGPFGMLGEVEAVAQLDSCKGQLRELFGDAGSAGRLEAFFASLAAPTVVVEG